MARWQEVKPFCMKHRLPVLPIRVAVGRRWGLRGVRLGMGCGELCPCQAFLTVRPAHLVPTSWLPRRKPYLGWKRKWPNQGKDRWSTDTCIQWTPWHYPLSLILWLCMLSSFFLVYHLWEELDPLGAPQPRLSPNPRVTDTHSSWFKQKISG